MATKTQEQRKPASRKNIKRDETKWDPSTDPEVIRVRKKSKRKMSKAEVLRALTALRALQFSTGKKTDSVKLLRQLRT